MEICDCTSVSSVEVFEINETSPVHMLPRGLGEVRDTLDVQPAPKPFFLKRVFLSIGLIFLHLSTWSVQFVRWICNLFCEPCHQKKLYNELFQIAQKGNLEEIQLFLKAHADEDHSTAYLFKELLSLPQLHPYLHEILKGANVCLKNDKGFFFKRWNQYREAYRRVSSHAYQDQQCYAIHHVLFWVDPEGNTRFQLENTPLDGFFNRLDHLIDYLRYMRDNEQQGVVGASPHTEQYCLSFPIEPERFLIGPV